MESMPFSVQVLCGCMVAALVAIIGLLIRVSIWCWRMWEVVSHGKLSTDVRELTKVMTEHAMASKAQCRLMDALVEKVNNVPQEVIREMIVQGLCKRQETHKPGGK